MKRTPSAVTGLLAALLAVGLTGCGSSSDSTSSGTSDSPTTAAPTTAQSSPAAAAGIDCSKAGDLTATAEKQPPADLPTIPGGQIYMSKGPFGKTLLFFEAVDADPANLDAPRDQAADLLVKAGYKLDRKDQEEGSEAEAHLTGPHDVAIQVIQLCQGKVRVKYTLTS
jgi:hypothetical protein